MKKTFFSSGTSKQPHFPSHFLLLSCHLAYFSSISYPSIFLWWLLLSVSRIDESYDATFNCHFFPQIRKTPIFTYVFYAPNPKCTLLTFHFPKSLLENLVHMLSLCFLIEYLSIKLLMLFFFISYPLEFLFSDFTNHVLKNFFTVYPSLFICFPFFDPYFGQRKV